ncbi:hypothetical protein C8N35_10319 [Breoghania corrubedonensis]|uniref:Uncharacterized protein n=1 Tax=Breoghania corrubedonensis TaxID=665038 RepID=A0A2T5VAQ8_9HYPH|nr:hypothetical protein C8N35_10319 [Breoghania corrubedonensis]
MRGFGPRTGGSATRAVAARKTRRAIWSVRQFICSSRNGARSPKSSLFRSRNSPFSKKPPLVSKTGGTYRNGQAPRKWKTRPDRLSRSTARPDPSTPHLSLRVAGLHPCRIVIGADMRAFAVAAGWCGSIRLGRRRTAIGDERNGGRAAAQGRKLEETSSVDAFAPLLVSHILKSSPRPRSAVRMQGSALLPPPRKRSVPTPLPNPPPQQARLPAAPTLRHSAPRNIRPQKHGLDVSAPPCQNNTTTHPLPPALSRIKITSHSRQKKYCASQQY